MKLNEIPEGDENKWVLLLTPLQKDQLIGRQWAPNSYFNPVLDGNDPQNWIISVEEAQGLVYPEFNWILDLPLILWIAPTPPEINE
jgi:hypothetical protein